MPPELDVRVWLKVEPAVVTHRKTKALARRWGCSPYAVVGFLIAFWNYLMEFQSDGRAADVPVEDLDELAAPCRSVQGELVSSTLDDLKATGFVDPDGKAHDWELYAGALLTRRERDAARKRHERAQSNGHPADVPRTSGRRVEQSREEKKQPSSPAANWLAPFIDLHREKAGEPNPGHLGKALKPVREALSRLYPGSLGEVRDRGLLTLFGRWLDAGHATYGPNHFARTWKSYVPGNSRKDTVSKQAIADFLGGA